MGTNLTISHGETSGEHAIILGADLVRTGRAEVAVVGGGDELPFIVYEVYRRLRGLSSQRGGPVWSSPYDIGRNGVILGEGAAMLVIESAARAAARGAHVYASLERTARFAVAATPHAWPSSARAALPPLRHLLAGDTGAPREPDLIYGGANSSRRLDACELDLFGRLLGETASRPWLTSVKGAVGEFGAAGALSTAAACLALDRGIVPPLCNLRTPEPSVPFRFPAVAARQPLTRILVCGIGRGGSGAALSLAAAS